MQTNTTKRIGIITAPGYTDRYEKVLKENLPKLFTNWLDNSIDWQVEYQVDPLTGITEDEGKIKKVISNIMQRKDWDIAICLTDLPFFHNNSPIVIELDKTLNIAWLSVPTLGITPLKKRIVNSVISIVRDLVDQPFPRTESRHSKNSRNLDNLKNITPIKRDEIDNIDRHQVFYTYKPIFIGYFLLLLGMIRANQPWVIFPHFLKIVVVAFTAGSFSLVFPAMWNLSDNYDVGRLLLVTCISISLMVSWIVLIHNLWEKPQDGRSKSFRKLYNITTILTLLITVGFYYIVLFISFIFASYILLPEELLHSNLSKEIDLFTYLSIAWTATCISTFIGAFGTTLDNEEAVLSSTYGYRQRQRYEKIKRQEELEENEKVE